MNEFQRRLFDMIGGNSYVARFVDKNREIALIDTYAYTAVDYASVASPITSALTRSNDVIMDTDSDFVLLFLSQMAFLAGSNQAVFNPAINIQITDKFSGRTWFNQPSPAAFMGGAMGFPFIVTSPRVIKPRSTLNVSYVADQATVSFTNFSFVMHGARIWYK